MFEVVPKYKIKSPPGGVKPSIYAVRWSYDGALLAAAIDDGRIRVYDGATGKTKFSLMHSEGESEAEGGSSSSSSSSDASHHPQHRAQRGFEDASAAAVAAHAATAAALQNKGINHATIALRWSPVIGKTSDGLGRVYTLLSSSSNGLVRHWRITQPPSGGSDGEPQQHPVCTREESLGNDSVAFCLDYDNAGKRFAAGCKDAVVRVYDEETGALVQTLDGGDGIEFSAHALPREMPSAEYALKLVNQRQADETAGNLNRESRQVSRHSNRLYSCKFTTGFSSHLDNLIISAGWDRTMQVWDLRAPGPAAKSFFGVYLSGDSLDCVGCDIVTASYRPVNQLQIWDIRMGNSAEPREVQALNTGTPHEFFCCQFSGNRDVNSHFDVATPADERPCFLAAGGTGASSLRILDHRRDDQEAAVVQDLPGGVVSLDFCPRIFQDPAAAAAAAGSTKGSLDTAVETPSGSSRYAHLKERHTPGEKARSGEHNRGTRLAIACKDAQIRVVDLCLVRSGGFAYQDEEEVDDGDCADDWMDVAPVPSPTKPQAAAAGATGDAAGELSVEMETEPPSDSDGQPCTLSPALSEGSFRTGFSPEKGGGALLHSESGAL